MHQQKREEEKSCHTNGLTLSRKQFSALVKVPPRVINFHLAHKDVLSPVLRKPDRTAPDGGKLSTQGPSPENNGFLNVSEAFTVDTDTHTPRVILQESERCWSAGKKGGLSSGQIRRWVLGAGCVCVSRSCPGLGHTINYLLVDSDRQSVNGFPEAMASGGHRQLAPGCWFWVSFSSFFLCFLVRS